MIIMNKDDVVIVSAVRTPFSRFGGALREIHSTDLGAIVIKECLKRVGMDSNQIDELYYGMCIQSEAALEYNVNGRQAMLKAGLRSDLVSLTLDRACCSSMTCVQMGFRSILLGEAEACMAVGAENMSNTPVVVNGHRWGSGLKPLTMIDHLNPIQYHGFGILAKDAGEVALEYGITREMQDEWALGSHQKYFAALEQGKFNDEIMPLELPKGKGKVVVFDRDEGPRADTSIESLAKLKPVYGSPTVTAGNAPGLDAGASAIIIMKRAKAEALGLKPLGTILSVASVAMEPRYIAAVPAPAIKKACQKAGVDLEQIDLIEINEAFAAMPLVATKILAEGDEAKWEAMKSKTNVNGGAVAIGHPVGASGARIIMTLMYELKRRGGGYGVASICGGLAQGDAAIIRVDA